MTHYMNKKTIHTSQLDTSKTQNLFRTTPWEKLIFNLHNTDMVARLTIRLAHQSSQQRANGPELWVLWLKILFHSWQHTRH